MIMGCQKMRELTGKMKMEYQEITNLLEDTINQLSEMGWNKQKKKYQKKDIYPQKKKANYWLSRINIIIK